MSDLVTIRAMHRYPTRGLAESVAPFLPNCGWKAKQRDRYWWLECRVEEHRAERMLKLLQGEHRGMRFEIIEQPARDAGGGDA